MHDALARDKNTIPTISEPKKWHPTKKKRTKWRSYGIHTKHGVVSHARVSMPTSSCQVCSSRWKLQKEGKGNQAVTAISSPTQFPLLLVRFVPQDENYKKKGRGHSSCYSHFQPNPVPTSCMKAYYTQKTKNDTEGFSGICTKKTV